MRRVWLSGVAVLALVAAVALWLRAGESAPVIDRAEPANLPEHDFRAVDVRAPANEGLTLTGTVRDVAGQPVADAEVFLAASGQQSLVSVRCPVCNELLLSCRASETAPTVATMLEAHRGELVPGASTRSDAHGAFRFEHLIGTSFTVWGHAANFGDGVKERAAPGDPVDLYLPSLRTLAGRLRDANGQPVEGRVRATSRRLTRVVEATSGPDGRFELVGLGEGPFFVQATAPGKLPATAQQVEAGPTPLTLTLLTPRRLDVRLLAQGQPVDGTVRVTSDHLAKESATQKGLATFEGLYPNSVLVSATSGELSALPQLTRLDADVTTVTLVLERGGTVAVTVVDEAEQPVPEPTVSLLTSNGTTVSKRKAKTGELVVFGPVGAGDYQVSVSALGFGNATLPAHVKSGETALEVTLSRATVIAGMVIDEFGRPAPGVSILVTPTGDSVIADGEGRFRAQVPSPGLYALHAHHSDWGGGEVKVTAPKTDVELQLEPKAGLEVTVMSEGRRVEGAMAMLIHEEGNFRSDRPSGADGVVLMRGLPPNGYALVAMHPDYLMSDRQAVKLEDGQLLKLTAELKPGAAITGQVVDELGTPVAGVTLAVTPRGAEPTTTDAKGQFTFRPLRPKAVYAVRVTSRGFDEVRTLGTSGGDPIKIVVHRQQTFRGRVLSEGQPVKQFSVDDHEVNSSDGTFELPLASPGTTDHLMVAISAPGYEPIVESRPRTPELGDFTLKRAPQVTGVVTDGAGGPVADAVVTCSTCDQSVMSDAEGHFTLSRPPFQREFTVVAKKGRRTATKATPAESSQGLQLVLEAGVRLSGTVDLPDGRVGAGVEVAGVNDDRSEPVSVVTAADGTYSMDIPPGRYRFIVATSMLESTDPPAVITEVHGSQARLDFGPAPGTGVITAHVSPAAGYALWLVRGTVTAVGNPPLELLRSSYAQMVYQPHTDRVTFGGLSPGAYTLIWASFHAESAGGPIVVPAVVPGSAEVTLIR